MNSCTVCNSHKLRLIDRAQSGENISDILECLDCSAILNCAAYENLLNAGNREVDVQSTDFYNIESTSLSSLADEVTGNRRLLTSLCEIAAFDPLGKVFLDFGAGRGCAAVAARQIFRKSTALDYNTSLLQSTFERLDANDVRIITRLDDVDLPVDFVFAWHVLEHLPAPSEVLRKLFSVVRPNGVLCLQVPKYRAEYIFDAHFVFYNHFSLNAVLIDSGFRNIRLFDDFSNHFLTAIADRP